MAHVTRKMLASTLNQLPSEFDTHLVERRILRNNTEAFATDLLECCGKTRDPLRKFSATFGKRIDRIFRRQIRKTRKLATENLGGKRSKNQEWEKIVARII